METTLSSTHPDTIRNKHDYYVTPDWMVREFLEEFLIDFPQCKESLILDPCAGGCSKNDMPYPTELISRGFRVISQDIREDSKALVKADYLNNSYMGDYDLIITNPPFDKSVPITQKAINESTITVVLQRLNWVGSDWRAKEFWKDAPLRWVYAHNKRASFTENGKKDSIEYAHFVFEKGYTGKAGFTLIL
jgi:hypothetical protein